MSALGISAGRSIKVIERPCSVPQKGVWLSALVPGPKSCCGKKVKGGFCVGGKVMRYEEAGPWRGKEGKERKAKGTTRVFFFKTYSAQMPRNMAVEGPHARVIRVVLEHHVPVRSQIVRVPPQRVLRVDNGVAVPLAVAFVQDPVFVAVEMHWLRKSTRQLPPTTIVACMERRRKR